MGSEVMALLPEHRALIRWLRQYVDGFREGRRLAPMLQSKWVHSARVARLCRDLADDLGWDDEARSSAETAGWLHDVGRFSQWAEYGTYHDGSSINHALRGHQVLLDASVLPQSVPQAAELLDAVRCHNMLEPPTDLAASSRPLVGLVRDADKLDIFEVIHAYLEQGRLGELLPRLAPEGPLSQELIEQIRTTRRASYVHARTIGDFLLIMASWVYDLNHGPSLRRVRDRDVMGRLRRALPTDPVTVELLAEAEAHVRSASS